MMRKDMALKMGWKMNIKKAMIIKGSQLPVDSKNTVCYRN
jgi:hypothetical protein